MCSCAMHEYNNNNSATFFLNVTDIFYSGDIYHDNTTYHIHHHITVDKHIRIVIISFYIIIFFTSFLGNLLVISVVVLQKKMRNSTNIFFTNLAISDLFLGLFCIFQDLTLYLRSDWPFGRIMCKMYHFTQTISYTSSIFTMVIICIERYIAICYPIKAKKVLQMKNFRILVIFVWVLSAIICSPNLWMFGVINVHNLQSGTLEQICIVKKLLFSIRIFNMMNALLLFFIPILLMSYLYIRLGQKLRFWDFPIQLENGVSEYNFRKVPNCDTIRQFITCEINKSSRCIWKKKDIEFIEYQIAKSNESWRHQESFMKESVTIARRRVIKLLVVIVLTFAICHLPIHVRKLVQDWYSGYRETAIEAQIATIATTLLTYLNSGLNPILYALLSSKFRKSIKNAFR